VERLARLHRCGSPLEPHGRRPSRRGVEVPSSLPEWSVCRRAPPRRTHTAPSANGIDLRGHAIVRGRLLLCRPDVPPRDAVPRVVAHPSHPQQAGSARPDRDTHLGAGSDCGTLEEQPPVRAGHLARRRRVPRRPDPVTRPTGRVAPSSGVPGTRGAERTRTAVRGFAGLCLTTRPRRQPGHRTQASESSSARNTVRRVSEPAEETQRETCLRCSASMEWRHRTWQCPRCRFKIGCCEGETGECRDSGR
jgi:hypothetical protein